MKYFTAVALIYLASFITSCASLDQRIDLIYENVVHSKGGSGELFISKPIEKYNALKKPSGALVVGMVKGTEREIITHDSTSDWVMLAFVQEFYTAGYNVKTVAELPADAPKGIKVTISELAANQIPGTLIIKTDSKIKLMVDLWKNGKLVKTLTTEAGHADEGLDRSAKPISILLKKTMQNLMQQLVPDIIKAIEEK